MLMPTMHFFLTNRIFTTVTIEVIELVKRITTELDFGSDHLILLSEFEHFTRIVDDLFVVQCRAYLIDVVLKLKADNYRYKK